MVGDWFFTHTISLSFRSLLVDEWLFIHTISLSFRSLLVNEWLFIRAISLIQAISFIQIIIDG